MFGEVDVPPVRCADVEDGDVGDGDEADLRFRLMYSIGLEWTIGLGRDSRHVKV
jgi:hypothetical protein